MLNSVEWWNTKLKQYLPSPFSQTLLFPCWLPYLTHSKECREMGNGACGQSVTLPVWVLSLGCSSGWICCSIGSSMDYKGDIWSLGPTDQHINPILVQREGRGKIKFRSSLLLKIIIVLLHVQKSGYMVFFQNLILQCPSAPQNVYWISVYAGLCRR